MIYIIVITVLGIVACYFCIRYFLLKKAVKEAAGELHEITLDLEQNRVVRLPSPQHEIEGLLEEVNLNLKEIRKTRVKYEDKKISLQKEIENVSHDLRTPLTSILGYLDLMDVDSMDSEDQESFYVIQRKAQSLKRLISRFYDLSRLIADDYKFDMKEVDLGRNLRETAMDCYQEMKRKDLKVQLNIPDEPAFVLADEEALERIFSNLLENAGRYAQSVLNISLLQEDSMIEVLLENDTEHLDQAAVHSMFHRFYTADRSRSEGSTGLGLPIAKYLAEGMGGQLSVEMKEQGERKWLRFHFIMQKINFRYF